MPIETAFLSRSPKKSCLKAIPEQQTLISNRCSLHCHLPQISFHSIELLALVTGTSEGDIPLKSSVATTISLAFEIWVSSGKM